MLARHRRAQRKLWERTVVLHGVQATLREECHPIRYDVDLNSAYAVLVDHPARHVSRDTHNSVVCALVEMWREHTAGPEFQQSVADSHASHCWECRRVGSDDGAVSVAEVAMVEEVVVPVDVFCEKRMSVVIRCCHLELSVEVWIERLCGACRVDETQKRSDDDHRSVHRVVFVNEKCDGVACEVRLCEGIGGPGGVLVGLGVCVVHTST